MIPPEPGPDPPEPEPDSINVKITNGLNNTQVFLYRLVKNGNLVSGTIRGFILNYNEASNVDIDIGDNDGVRFRVQAYTSTKPTVSDYSWNAGTDVGWKINGSTNAVTDVLLSNGDSFVATWDNLQNYATQS